MNILVSTCLLGLPCRYDGESRLCPEVLELMKVHHLVPVCPETIGGLSTPRPPAERRGERVVTREGRDVTEEYRRGAEAALTLCRLFDCKAALLKERSPSCGCGSIHNGLFDGGLIEGDGVTAELLREHGIPVYGESEWKKLLPPETEKPKKI